MPQAPAPSAGESRGAGRRGGTISRWLKPLVTIGLYAAIFSSADTRAIAQRLAGAELGWVAAGVALYMAGQALSAWKWHLLLPPVALSVRYGRVLAFYYIGMFFNLFLPTIVGGDAVKALLLTRETGAPARSTVSVFMERNAGLLALLSIALAASLVAPPVEVLGLSLVVITLVLFAGFATANIVLVRPWGYRLADRLIAATPLARFRPRAASLYTALQPYTRAHGPLAAAVGLSMVFQLVVICVVFFNARALHHEVPFAAVAVFVPLISLAGMIPVSVNGLGVREALYILLFGRLGAPAELSVSLALLYLAVTLIASLPGGLVYLLQRTPARLVQTGQVPADR